MFTLSYQLFEAICCIKDNLNVQILCTAFGKCSNCFKLFTIYNLFQNVNNFKKSDNFPSGLTGATNMFQRAQLLL